MLPGSSLLVSPLPPNIPARLLISATPKPSLLRSASKDLEDCLLELAHAEAGLPHDHHAVAREDRDSDDAEVC